MNNARVCIPVCEETADQFISRIRAAERRADIIELRFDCLLPDEREKLIQALNFETFTKPLLATFRVAEQGGHTTANFEERQRFWSSLPAHVWGVDVEEDAVELPVISGVRIVSHHDFSGVPADLDAIFDRLAGADADIVKIACQTDDAVDAIPLWRLIERASSRQRLVIPIAMGEAGKWTRVLGPAYGAYMTYASLEAAAGTAPGQITADDMQDVYRIAALDRETHVYGVIGDPISQSLSPHMQNAAFAEAGLNAVFIHLLVRDVAAFFTRMVRPTTREVPFDICGLSVTMPHKRSIIPLLDALDPVAEAIGAVNTVKIENGRLTGFNTDAHGFISPLRSMYGDLRGARVAVCGAGGASRACVYALEQEGADAKVFARDEGKAKALADEFGLTSGPLSALTEKGARPGAEFDILVNATPMGMKGPLHEATLFAAEQLEGVRLVFDLVTSAVDTPLIREAGLAGAETIVGREMLITQGARQFEIWTGREAPVETMRTAVLKRM